MNTRSLVCKVYAERPVLAQPPGGGGVNISGRYKGKQATACSLTRSNTTTFQPMPPALTGSMLSHAAQAASFSPTFELTDNGKAPRGAQVHRAPRGRRGWLQLNSTLGAFVT